MSFSHRDDVLPVRFTGGMVNWRVRLVHVAAQIAGILVHVEGLPYGTRRNLKPRETTAAASGGHRMQGLQMNNPADSRI